MTWEAWPEKALVCVQVQGALGGCALGELVVEKDGIDICIRWIGGSRSDRGPKFGTEVRELKRALGKGRKLKVRGEAGFFVMRGERPVALA